MALQHHLVCERIGQRPLYLGSSRAAREGVAAPSFEHVVTLSSHRQPLTTEYIPLTEGEEMEFEQFRKAVDVVRRRFGSEPTLVQCEVGISRSSAVIATAIAAEEEMEFREALEEVKKYRKRASPRRPLREYAGRYLNEGAQQSSV